MMVMTSLQRKIIIVIIKSNVSMIIFTTLMMMIKVKATITKVQVVDCPDLREWGCAACGLGGDPVLVLAGSSFIVIFIPRLG